MVLAAGQRFYLFAGDNRALMANMGDGVVDSIVCDPPYELTSISKRFGGPNAKPAQHGKDGSFQRLSGGFMNQRWDATGIAFDAEMWAEVLRVLKPGGHLLAFSGSRTYHRMAVAIEDAGFEIRDQIMWLYGSGFPKSHDISKAIDKAAGANDAARQWEGWGTALKPAHEPIVLARKPLDGTVAGNVLAHGVGGLNIDGCRVGTEQTTTYRPRATSDDKVYGKFAGGESSINSGRFPANVIHDGSDEVVAGFPAQAGAAAPVTKRNGDKFRNTFGAFAGNIDEAGSTFHGDSGSAARFFYCAKASKADRDEGLEAFETQTVRARYGEQGQGPLDKQTPRVSSEQKNIHPTVKPTALMRYLVRLVTPPGGLVFDPFTGSGSTGKAAMLEGFRFIGAEMTDDYVPIARARIQAALDATVTDA